MKYSCIAYYMGPEIKRSFVDKLVGRPGNIVYQINPQIYSNGLSEPIVNVGIFEVAFQKDNQPDQGELENVLSREVRKLLKAGVARREGGVIIPVENIDIKLESHEE